MYRSLLRGIMHGSINSVQCMVLSTKKKYDAWFSQHSMMHGSVNTVWFIVLSTQYDAWFCQHSMIHGSVNTEWCMVLSIQYDAWFCQYSMKHWQHWKHLLPQFVSTMQYNTMLFVDGMYTKSFFFIYKRLTSKHVGPIVSYKGF